MQKILIIITGNLPIPAVKGGAVEALTDAYLNHNEKTGKYHFTVYSAYAPEIKNFINRHKYSVFRYINTRTLLFKLARYARAFLNKILHLPIQRAFIHAVLKDLTKHDNENFDYIIVENDPTIINALAKKYPNKIILHLHNDNLNYQTREAYKTYRNCRSIYTVSNYIKTRVETITGPTKTTVLMNGINQKALRSPVKPNTRTLMRKQYGLNEHDTVFMFGGRVCPDKGVHELLQAFIKAEKSCPNIKLLIVGSSFFNGAKATSYIKKLQTLAKNYQDKIIFTGYIDHADMGKIYSAADAQVIPSMFDDPCPLAVLEGMSMGLPQIATLSGGIPEQTTKDNTILIERTDIVNQLANAMIKLANNPALRQKMSQASLAHSQAFTEKTYIEEFYRLLNQETQKGGKA